MTSSHIHRTFWILALTLLTGLGLALALPSLAQAGQSARGDQQAPLTAATTIHVAKTGDGSDGLS